MTSISHRKSSIQKDQNSSTVTAKPLLTYSIEPIQNKKRKDKRRGIAKDTFTLAPVNPYNHKSLDKMPPLKCSAKITIHNNKPKMLSCSNSQLIEMYYEQHKGKIDKLKREKNQQKKQVENERKRLLKGKKKVVKEMQYKLMLSKLSQDIHRWKKQFRVSENVENGYKKKKLSAFKVQDPKLEGMVKMSEKKILEKADLQTSKIKLSSTQMWYQSKNMGEMNSYISQA